ncbi:MAG TPA: ABC transporter substrate binding protein, partial [Methylomirabilota bacterium]|nr:ABC transporter substrate binding protein [Methylomirabilota bacterium]
HANPNIPIIAEWLRATEAAARRLGLALHPVRMPAVRLPDEIGQWEPLFEMVSRRGIGAGTIHEAPHLEEHRQVLADFALKHQLPMVFTFRSQAQAGGLMSYAPDLEEIMRRAGSLAARILKGAKPADLPVEEPTKYQLVLNLKTARSPSE